MRKRNRQQRMKGLLLIAGGLLCLLVWLRVGIARTRPFVNANQAYENSNYQRAISLGNANAQRCRGTICEHGKYNQANALVQLGVQLSQEQVSEQNRSYWQQAHDIYTQLLQEENHTKHKEMIRNNLNIVKQLLEDFSSESEENQENQENQQQEGQQGQEDQQQNQQGEEEGQQEDEQGEESQSGQEGENEQPTQSGNEQMISEATREQLEEYQEVLQQQEYLNQQYFSPIPREDQQSLSQELGDNNGEKDW